MARTTDDAADTQGGRGRLGEQNCPDGLGIDDQRRALQGADRRIKVGKTRRAVADDVGKGEQELMHKAS